MTSAYLNRNSDLEAHFKKVGLDLVFLAKDATTLNSLIEKSIAESEEFQQMPVFRRIAVMNFIEGAQRGIARLLGEEAKEKFQTKSTMRAPAKTEDVPRVLKKLQPDAKWHRHINGGGWVASTAYVESTAFVGSKAVVYQNARVLDRARIYGAAKIRGNAECFGACHVHGLAIVEDDAKVFDAAKVLGKTVLGGTVRVGGFSVVRGSTELRDDVELIDERVAPKHSDIQELGSAGASRLIKRSASK